MPSVGRQLALSRFPAPATRLDGRELQRRGPQRGLVAAGQEQLQHLRVVHTLHGLVVDVRDQVAGAQARLERRTPGINGLYGRDTRKKKKNDDYTRIYRGSHSDCGRYGSLNRPLRSSWYQFSILKPAKPYKSRKQNSNNFTAEN